MLREQVKLDDEGRDMAGRRFTPTTYNFTG